MAQYYVYTLWKCAMTGRHNIVITVATDLTIVLLHAIYREDDKLNNNTSIVARRMALRERASAQQTWRKS